MNRPLMHVSADLLAVVTNSTHSSSTNYLCNDGGGWFIYNPVFGIEESVVNLFFSNFWCAARLSVNSPL